MERVMGIGVGESQKLRSSIGSPRSVETPPDWLLIGKIDNEKRCKK
jgi:hypothetical protein